MKSKYVGKIYDGRWKVVRNERYGAQKGGSGRFFLQNIYNQKEISLKDVTLRRIDRGETTVSKVLSMKIRKGRG